jgi:hypothetical protein
MSEEIGAFLDYILSAHFRFLQERYLGLDLYYSGSLGILVFCLFIVTLTVFFLAIFQVIPRRSHVIWLLLGLGGVSILLGLVCSFWNFHALREGGHSVIQEAAGARPANREQEAAIVAIPLLLGAATLSLGLFGCTYLALFWGGNLFSKNEESEKANGKKKKR